MVRGVRGVGPMGCRMMHSRTKELGRQLLSATATAVGGDLVASKRALAKAITLAESSRAEDLLEAADLIGWLGEERRRLGLVVDDPPVIRIAISGAPGVGKSTFIEAFGSHLIAAHGRQVAVLAVDPSSRRSGGSILGDKTRMNQLARNPRAYVRPSPSRGTLGGVTRSTDDALALCEAAGFNVLLCETVGVGQSEVAAEQLVDVFILLEAPAMGDSLQGIKKGIVEMADVIVINKSDGPRRAAARRTLAHMRQALRLVMPKNDEWSTKVLPCSASRNEGLEEIWTETCALRDHLQASGRLLRKQEAQRVGRMWTVVDDLLMKRLLANGNVQAQLGALENDVRHQLLTPGAAAQKILTLGDD